MAAIDLIVLGMLKKEPMGAYDIQKLVEYRNISKWVKISTPSIYKKAIQLEERGFIKGSTVKEGKCPKKSFTLYPFPVKIFLMGNKENCTGKFHQCSFQHLFCLNIQMVRRLVQYQKITRL